MRTIYLACGDNHENYDLHRWWNIQDFNSKEDAERFIIEKQEEYLRDMMRIYELDDRRDIGAITDEEKAEYSEIVNKWHKIVDNLIRNTNGALNRSNFESN